MGLVGKILYHGNPNKAFVPAFGAGRDYHDYGNAFYCTEDFDSAAQWACMRKNIETAYVYEYELRIPQNITPPLKVLNFDEYDPIYWLSALLEHRVANDEDYQDELRDRSIAFVEKYPTNCNDYDIIYGWRANDRHFAIIRDFLNTLTSIEVAKKAIILGDLGKQTVIKSERAYTWLKNIENPQKTVITGAEYQKWHNEYRNKDSAGRTEYDEIVKEARRLRSETKERGTTILSLLGW